MKINDNRLFPRKVVIVIFYDKNLNLLVQKRNSHSKAGEKFGFFGGGIEEGETPKRGLIRELAEELGYKPKNLRYWGKYSFIIDEPSSKFNNEVRYGELFLSPVTSELLNAKVEDDTEKVLLPLDKVLRNRNKEFGPVKFNDVLKIKKDLTKLAKELG